MSAANVLRQPAAAHQSGLAGLLGRHKLVSFFVLAYAGTWLVWVPYALSGSPLLAAASPALVSFWAHS